MFSPPVTNMCNFRNGDIEWIFANKPGALPICTASLAYSAKIPAGGWTGYCQYSEPIKSWLYAEPIDRRTGPCLSLSPYSLSPAITDSDRIHRERTILQMNNERKEGSEGRQYPSFALFGGWRIARPRDKSICRMVSGGFAQLFPKHWVVILSILRCLITTRHMLVSVFSKHNINTAFWLLRL